MRVFSPEKIKERRNSLRLTQGELARRAGTARVYIAQIERGKSNPTASLLAKIANALKVRVSYFFVKYGRKI
jgi:transcriptional regulator with XRE-family HTH domain